MLFANKIRQLREERKLLQRHLAAVLDMDTPMFSKIERGDRKAKRDQVIQLARLLDADVDELLTLWLAGQVYELIEDEAVAKEVLEFVKNKI